VPGGERPRLGLPGRPELGILKFDRGREAVDQALESVVEAGAASLRGTDPSVVECLAPGRPVPEAHVGPQVAVIDVNPFQPPGSSAQRGREWFPVSACRSAAISFAMEPPTWQRTDVLSARAVS